MKNPWQVWLAILTTITILGWIDLQTGFELNFFVFYFLPVSYAAWRLSLAEAVAVAVLCAVVWYGGDHLSGHTYSSPFYAVWNTVIRLCAFLMIGVALHRVRTLIRAEQERTQALQKALSEIKVLESFLSICCQCKKIRTDSGQWQQMESYISEHSATRFSHGYCPECARKLLEEAGLTNRK